MGALYTPYSYVYEEERDRGDKRPHLCRKNAPHTTLPGTAVMKTTEHNCNLFSTLKYTFLSNLFGTNSRPILMVLRF
ncbi:unnamed protein product [Acanthoscelides obtectus]|uniref:Uncharacterized protein n=1 Tax=Acanthoscelides obtectus TaxID=200917 RepID=A0A9P0KZZ7_ACAOB|nr:unnamed protein product [Acanthoscelides obtectus]CAK1672438.1 hypothetical protein AOBTE_LOCUS28892 [Acanthoscelides obtectus]